jgi:CHAD domain-containing protein
MTAADLIAQSCRETLAAIRKYRAASLRLEVEPVHQMRVGARRLRAILTLFRDVMDEQWATELENELRWLVHVLGTVRDLDVLRARLRDSAKKLFEKEKITAIERRSLTKLHLMLGTRHSEAQTAMIEGLKSERYRMLIARLQLSTHSPQLALEAGGPAMRTVAPFLQTAWKKLSRDASKLRREEDALKFHSLRKMGKRLRYASEAVQSELDDTDRDNSDRFIKALKKLQDTLGELQDAHVASETLLQMMETSGDGSQTYRSALRRLLKSEIASEKKARRKFQKRWDATAKPSYRKWLK